ncbi:hypothetical protein FA13DRAFT_1809827 [Coprinellus micaceus]|uniref:Uncharacterized protein n=1 Tax=Coprinellus micaceus TaxID=71717 RepID=A0A4Y7TTL8_COPMI|nr:hypothetical protein FA13DRAFT_1809827 [Coprinellus micaceus]
MREPAPVEPAQLRIVPGAPPKDVPSKAAAKRRRKAKGGKGDQGDDAPATPIVDSAALTPAAPAPIELKPDLAPPPTITREGSAAPGSAQVGNSPLPDDDGGPLLSPIAELVNKRLKATSKKITRFVGYASMEPEKLNDDQKRSVKSISVLEAVQKELGEVKKVIENYEADLAQGLAAKRLDSERAEKERIQTAISTAESTIISRTSTLLSFLRLSVSFGTAPFESAASAVFADDLERGAVYSLAQTLTGADTDSGPEVKDQLLNGFLKLEGEFQGVGFARIDEIVHALLNAPTPIPESPIDDRQQSVSAPSVSGDDRGDPTATAGPGLAQSQSLTGSFHFMQESEIDEPAQEEEQEHEHESNFEESAEWVEKPVEFLDVGGDIPPPPGLEHPNGTVAAAAVAPTVEKGAVGTSVGGGGSTLDWANTEGEDSLPPIESLQPSGSATPADPTTVEGIITITLDIGEDLGEDLGLKAREEREGGGAWAFQGREGRV